jgi:hypothetical protein
MADLVVWDGTAKYGRYLSAQVPEPPPELPPMQGPIRTRVFNAFRNGTALTAFAVATETGIELTQVQDAIGHFVRRGRFQVVGRAYSPTVDKWNRRYYANLYALARLGGDRGDA